MHFDLNFPVTASVQPGQSLQPKKNKGKQPQQPSSVAFTPAQIKAIEARLDVLQHCLFTVSCKVTGACADPISSRIQCRCIQSNHSQENRPKNPCQHS